MMKEISFKCAHCKHGELQKVWMLQYSNVEMGMIKCNLLGRLYYISRPRVFETEDCPLKKEG